MQRVVRVAAIGIDCDQGRIVGHEILTPEGFHEPLLHFVFVSAAVAHTPADLLESRRGDGVNRIARREVRLDLFFAQSGFEQGHQIARTDHILAQSADQVDGARVHQRNGEDQIVGRILHRDIAMIGQDRFYLFEQFLPAGILALASGERVEMAGLNLVDQLYGFAFGRNQVVPAPGDHLTCGQSQHAVSDGIAVMVIVKEPGVDVPLAERSLYGGKIHGQTTILNNGGDLSESGLTTEDTEAAEKILRVWSRCPGWFRNLPFRLQQMQVSESYRRSTTRRPWPCPRRSRPTTCVLAGG